MNRHRDKLHSPLHNKRETSAHSYAIYFDTEHRNGEVTGSLSRLLLTWVDSYVRSTESRRVSEQQLLWRLLDRRPVYILVSETWKGCDEKHFPQYTPFYPFPPPPPPLLSRGRPSAGLDFDSITGVHSVAGTMSSCLAVRDRTAGGDSPWRNAVDLAAKHVRARGDTISVKRGEYGAAPECKGRVTEDPRENLPTSGIVRLDFRERKFGIDPIGNRAQLTLARTLGMSKFKVRCWQAKTNSTRGGVVVRLLVSHLGEPDSIPCVVTPGFLHLGIMPGRCRWSADFLGVLSFPQLLNFDAVAYSPNFTIIASQGLDSNGLPHDLSSKLSGIVFGVERLRFSNVGNVADVKVDHRSPARRGDCVLVSCASIALIGLALLGLEREEDLQESGLLKPSLHDTLFMLPSVIPTGTAEGIKVSVAEDKERIHQFIPTREPSWRSSTALQGTVAGQHVFRTWRQEEFSPGIAGVYERQYEPRTHPPPPRPRLTSCPTSSTSCIQDRRQQKRHDEMRAQPIDSRLARPLSAGEVQTEALVFPSGSHLNGSGLGVDNPPRPDPPYYRHFQLARAVFASPGDTSLILPTLPRAPSPSPISLRKPHRDTRNWSLIAFVPEQEYISCLLADSCNVITFEAMWAADSWPIAIVDYPTMKLVLALEESDHSEAAGRRGTE
ncbi:hypothetical protein PR048_030610 [Dryococelus australis]|uniref:Uncharacterized protein n=1 Tax=Dryococelus australis TaxID=614101 RepID=A0ABQ9G9F5_9NEOP|nr:hypothetical protein PR048_030610 [Dryococelus australis]